MTIASNIRKSGPYTASAGQRVFNYTFPLSAAAAMAVLRLRDGVETALILDADYVVTGVGSDVGGTFVLTSDALAGDKYAAIAATPAERTTAFAGWKSLSNERVDHALDELQKQLQEHERDIDRALVANFFDGNYSVRGHRLTNMGAAVDIADAVTLGQLQDYVIGSGGGNIVGPGGASDRDVVLFDGASGHVIKSGGSFAALLAPLIGTAVQPWSAVLQGWSLLAPPSSTPVGVSDAQALSNKSISGTSNAISNLSTSAFASGVIDTDPSLAAGSPTRLASQSATKSYVDAALVGAAVGVVWQPDVRAASTPALTAVVHSGEQTLDGVALVAGNSFLDKDNSSAATRGVYVVASGAWTRRADADSEAELARAGWLVREGTVNAGTQWSCITAPIATLGSTALSFAQIGSPSAAATEVLQARAGRTSLGARLDTSDQRMDDLGRRVSAGPIIDGYAQVYLTLDGDMIASQTPGDVLKWSVGRASAAEQQAREFVRALRGSDDIAELQVGNLSGVKIDADGCPVSGIDDDGVTVVRGISGRFGPVLTLPLEREKSPFVIGSDVYLTTPSFELPIGPDEDAGILFYGQSYTGSNAAVDGGEPADLYDPHNPGWALMPAVGQFPQGPFFGYTDLKTTTQVVDGVTQSFGIGGPEFCRRVLATMYAKFGVYRRLVVIMSYRGGYTINQLAVGSPQYTFLLEGVANGVKTSRSMGRQLTVRAVNFTHGESQLYEQPWRLVRAYQLFFRRLFDDIRSLTGQTFDPKVILTAPMRGRSDGPEVIPTTRAFQEIVAWRPDIFCMAGANYGVEHNSEIHPTQQGYRQLAILQALAFEQMVFGQGFIPCQVVHAIATGSTTCKLLVSVPDGGSLIKDTSGSIIGYPASPADQAYIGPGSGVASDRDGGICARDPQGLLGVTSALVNASELGGYGGLKVIDIIFHRAYVPGATNVMIAPLTQAAGQIGGTQANGPRCAFRGSVAIPISGSTQTLYPWLMPGQYRI